MAFEDVILCDDIGVDWVFTFVALLVSLFVDVVGVAELDALVELIVGFVLPLTGETAGVLAGLSDGSFDELFAVLPDCVPFVDESEPEGLTGVVGVDELVDEPVDPLWSLWFPDELDPDGLLGVALGLSCELPLCDGCGDDGFVDGCVSDVDEPCDGFTDGCTVGVESPDVDGFVAGCELDCPLCGLSVVPTGFPAVVVFPDDVESAGLLGVALVDPLGLLCELPPGVVGFTAGCDPCELPP